MDLTREAIETIQKTAQQAQTAVLVPIPGDGRIAYVSQGGAITSFRVEADPRSHQAGTLADLLSFAKTFHGPAPVIWHDEDGVRLLLDDADRRDVVLFPLSITPMFKKIEQLEESRPCFEQKAFVRLLRLDFNLDAALIQPFRKLDFELMAKSSGEVNRTGDRMGNFVNSQVSSTGEIPETLTLTAPLYLQSGERESYEIVCAVEIDAAIKKIQIIPLPGQIDDVKERHQQSIRRRLLAGVEAIQADAKAEAQIPVYYGTP